MTPFHPMEPDIHALKLRAARFSSPGALIAVLVLSGCSSEPSGDGPRNGSIPSVEAVQSREGALPLTQRLSGVVRARNHVDIYSQLDAAVTEILVQNGDAVTEGQPLVRLRDREPQERLKQARANHQVAVAELRRAEATAREARAGVERVRALAGRGLTSDADLETEEARTESAEAGVQLAEARVEQSLAAIEEQEEALARTVVRAPISGHVGNRAAEVGMLARPGTRLLTLGQLDSVRVAVVLTDLMLAFIEEGQRVEVRVGDRVMSAPLSRISPFLNPVTHSTEAEIDMPNPDGLLRPGMFTTVDVYYGESETATLVPISSLYEHPGTGAVGVYVTRATLDGNHRDEEPPQSIPLSEPVDFEFVSTNIVAEGRMEAAIDEVEPGTWVMTLGQNLLGGEAGRARVRAVDWSHVERLQRLQREDLMRGLIESRPAQ